MEKVLVVYYSLTGNTKLIAQAINEAINSDILEIKPKDELDPDSGMKYFWGGYRATMRKKPELEPFSVDPLDYDTIFIGSPVWAWRQSPPIHSFIKRYDFTGKNIALWLCAGGLGGKAMERFKKAFKEVNILDSISFKEPLQNNPEDSKKRAADWASSVFEKISN